MCACIMFLAIVSKPHVTTHKSFHWLILKLLCCNVSMRCALIYVQLYLSLSIRDWNNFKISIVNCYFSMQSNFDFFDRHLSSQCHLYQCPYNVIVGWDLILGSCLSWVVLRLMKPCKVDIYHQKMEKRELSAKNLFTSIEIFSPILWRWLIFLCLFVLYPRIFVTHHQSAFVSHIIL